MSPARDFAYHFMNCKPSKERILKEEEALMRSEEPDMKALRKSFLQDCGKTK
jgi:hypothetical protein